MTKSYFIVSIRFTKEALLASCFHADLLLGLFFDPEDGGNVPPKRWLTFN
jgi:hypothetical protein